MHINKNRFMYILNKGVIKMIHNQKDVKGVINSAFKKYGYELQSENGRCFIDNRKFRIYFVNIQVRKDKYVMDMVIKEKKEDGNWVEKVRKFLPFTNGAYLPVQMDSLIQSLFSMGYLGLAPDNLDIEKDKLFEQIAKKHLYINTLETQKSDSLDFHDVSVWGIKAAFDEIFETALKLGYKMGKDMK